MKIKNNRKLACCIVSFVVAIGMIACSSHENPLKATQPTVAAKFLVTASQSAEKALHVFSTPGGYYYGECMTGHAKKQLCQQLYQLMVQYAQTTSYFKTITVKDLTDSAVFESLKGQYQREQFNAI